MAKVVDIRGGKAGIQATEIVDGQRLIDLDNRKLYMDRIVNNVPERVEMSMANTFSGSKEEWDNLTPEQKAGYDYVDVTDDYEYNDNIFDGATASADGKKGLVPPPLAGQQGKFLRGDATWADVITDVDNAIDATSTNPVQNAVIKAALDTKVDNSSKGVASGVASLDVNGKLPKTQMPATAGYIIEGATSAAFPVTGESNTVYLALDTNKPYRWDGTQYVEIQRIYVDDAISSTSTNPVQNSVIYTELDKLVPKSRVGVPMGVATLDTTGKIPSAQLPGSIGYVVEAATKNDFPPIGDVYTMYIALDTNKVYRWSGSLYVELQASLVLGETSDTAYAGDKGKVTYDHAVTRRGNSFPSGLYKITTNQEGHVTAASAVTKADITALGIPGTENTLTLGETATTAYAGDKGAAAYAHAVTNKGNAFVNGLYKITTNEEGHVIGATPVVKKDITDLGIPGEAGGSDVSITECTGTYATLSQFVQASARGELITNYKFTDTGNIFGLGASTVVKGTIQYQNAYDGTNNVYGNGILYVGASEDPYWVMINGISSFTLTKKQINPTKASIGLGNVDNLNYKKLLTYSTSEPTGCWAGCVWIS